MRLDKHALLEEREWRTRNFERAVETIIRTMQDALAVEVKRILTWGVTYVPDEDQRIERTHADVAAEMQHTLIQALNNCDFRGLTMTASELTLVEKSLISLDNLKAELPAAAREALIEREEERLHVLTTKREHQREEFERHQAEQCRAAVHESGRGVGFYQCTRSKPSNKSYTVNQQGEATGADAEGAMQVRLCSQHAKELMQRGRISLYKREKRKLDIRPKKTALEAAPPKEIEGSSLEQPTKEEDSR